MGYYKYGGIYVDDGTNQKAKTHNPYNKLNPTELEVGWVNTTVGGADNLSTANTGTRTTKAIPCTQGQVVTMGYIHSYDHNPFFIATSVKFWCLAYAFFNSSGKVIAGASSRPSVVDGVVAPANTSYVRVTYVIDGYDDPTKTPEKFFVYVGAAKVENPTYYFPNGVEYLDTDDSMILDHWGETWTMFGDSLTDSYGGHGWDASESPVGGDGWHDTEERVSWKGRFWASTIARKHGFIMDNRAHSGSNIYNSRTSSASYVAGVTVIDEYAEEIANGTIKEPSLITVGFGANTVQDEIGNEADEPSNTTKSMYAGAKYFIEKLKATCPHARIVYILHPLQTGWRDTDGKAREAMRKLFESYNVEYVDMSKASGITTDMLPDGLHVSSKEANAQYGRYLERYLF